ncbi:hypothetical protein GCM10009775_16110 [Microbacterium aoyamense]|uniref:Uncharacterized protein n=1 Tax=Microbacterium aoyamense TaxID=344166 RepID=A0ABN2PP83_9MICO|nr:hypothetical protein [Microbacterium aoyamense]
MTWFTESRTWASGPWSLALRGDEFADIAFDGRVVLRSIRAVVRDRNWDTAPLVVDRVAAHETTLTLHVRSEALGSSFRGVVRVEARADRLDVLCDLESEHPFATNRTGLVVLHPPHVAGAPLRVSHADGRVEQTEFPRAISPHQPVFDIAGLTWLAGGLEVSTTFDGDAFEMEDQRNWTDASFKTYSRPLDLPFPYDVAAGERVRQMVSLRVRRTSESTAMDAAPVGITLQAGGEFPHVALGAASAPDPAPTFAPLGSHVLVELDLASPNWRAALDRSASSGLPLDVRFVLDAENPDALTAGVAALGGRDVVRVAAFHQVSDARHVSDREAVADLRAALAAAGLDIPVVGGSRSHFTELNRERHRIPNDLDGLTVTVTPLFHALGTEQLVESLAMQRLVALQSVDLAGGSPVHVGPITLRPRFNDVATGPQPGPTRADLAEGYGAEFTGVVDERQTAPELAAWTIASAAALGVPGTSSLAWFEEWGPRGIHSTPAADALAALAPLEGGELLWGDSPDGLVWAIGARTNGETVLLAANLDHRERELTIETPAHEVIAVTLGAASFRRLTITEEDPT